MLQGGKNETQSREELGKYCEEHGIAAACFVEKCSPEDLEQLKELARSGDFPELSNPKGPCAESRL